MRQIHLVNRNNRIIKNVINKANTMTVWFDNELLTLSSDGILTRNSERLLPIKTINNNLVSGNIEIFYTYKNNIRVIESNHEHLFLEV